jgi:hypothetical protein
MQKSLSPSTETPPLPLDSTETTHNITYQSKPALQKILQSLGDLLERYTYPPAQYLQDQLKDCPSSLATRIATGKAVFNTLALSQAPLVAIIPSSENREPEQIIHTEGGFLANRAVDPPTEFTPLSSISETAKSLEERTIKIGYSG